MSERHRPGDDAARRAERARDVALFRYALIREAADASLSTRARGVLVRDLAGREHTGPFGGKVMVSRVSLDRWVRAWRTGGFDALVPSARHAQPRTPSTVLELAVALKREVPARTAAQAWIMPNAPMSGAIPTGAPSRHGSRISSDGSS